MFYRMILNVPISVPKESLYIETGKIPIRYIIQTRRLMFWWHMVNLKESEVLFKFFKVQKLKSSKDDWVKQLEKDKKDLNLEMSDQQAKQYSKEQFKNLVKAKVEINAGKQLEGIRMSHSKTENIKFSGFKPAEYFLSKNLTVGEVQTLFKLRTRMVDVKQNFKHGQEENMWCKLCHLFVETQQHLLECPVIRSELKKIINFQELDIGMVTGNISKQEKIAKKYNLILQKRKDLMDD